MSFTPPPANKIANFLMAGRKSNLIPFGLFSPDDNLDFIYNPGTVGIGTPVQLTGTINGINTVFVSPLTINTGIEVFLNGLYQDPFSSYSVSGNTVTLVAPPRVGDTLQALVS